MEFRLGEKFHSFVVLDICGRGAFGEVYRVHDLSNKILALKVIRKFGLSGDNWRKELQGLSSYRKVSMSHPNLLQIYHVDEDESFFYYTMEAADSFTEDHYDPVSLERKIIKQPLSCSELFTLGHSLLSALQTIHSAGLAHRDMKPGNIVYVNGIPKIGDIGLMASSSQNSLAGTPGFFPVEMYRNKRRDELSLEETQCCDLYALGKTLYCALSGFSPEYYPEFPSWLSLSSEAAELNRIIQLLLQVPERCRQVDELENYLSERLQRLRTSDPVLERNLFIRPRSKKIVWLSLGAVITVILIGISIYSSRWLLRTPLQSLFNNGSPALSHYELAADRLRQDEGVEGEYTDTTYHYKILIPAGWVLFEYKMDIVTPFSPLYYLSFRNNLNAKHDTLLKTPFSIPWFVPIKQGGMEEERARHDRLTEASHEYHGVMLIADWDDRTQCDRVEINVSLRELLPPNITEDTFRPLLEQEIKELKIPAVIDSIVFEEKDQGKEIIKVKCTALEQYPIYWEFHLTQDSLVIFKLIVFEKKNLAKRKKRFQKIIDSFEWVEPQSTVK